MVTIWEYDKRPVNGANFVYYGMRLVGSDSKKAKEMIAYADGVLDALGIRQGPSHMEVSNVNTCIYNMCVQYILRDVSSDSNNVNQFDIIVCIILFYVIFLFFKCFTSIILLYIISFFLFTSQ